jgi:uncharacterized protein YjiS (DUF1127 family)
MTLGASVQRELVMSTERLSLEMLDLVPPDAGFGRRMLEVARRWRVRAQGRAVLARMNPHQLRDIGLSEADVWRETRLPRRH